MRDETTLQFTHPIPYKKMKNSVRVIKDTT